MKTKAPYFIDFEASSLSFDSYPIEVAWSNSKDNIEAYLISPQKISSWTDWSVESQKIHGIHRDELIQNGKDPQFVCERIYATLDNQIVYSDASPFDMDWLKKLYEATNMPLPNFSIRDIDELCIAELACADIGADSIVERLETLKIQAKNKVQKRHRATYDVEYLIELNHLCTCG